MKWLSGILDGRAQPQVLDPALREILAHWHTLSAPDLSRTHGETRYAVLNTHAAGLDPAHHELLSVGAVAIESGRIDTDSAYHGFLGSAPQRVLAELLTFSRSGPVVVFNASINRVLLERAFAQHLGVTPNWVWLDLYRLLPALFGECHGENTRLSTWMGTLGADTFQRFHALGDAYAVARLMLAVESRALRRGLATPRQLADLERSWRNLERR